MGPPALFPIREENVLHIFIALKIHPFAGFEPVTFGSSDKHINHYTTKTTSLSYWQRRYLLLLRGGIVQSVPCNCDHFLVYCAPHLSYNHSRFIHQSSLFWLQQRHLVAKREELGKKWPLNFAYQCVYHTSRDLKHDVKSYDIGPTGLLPFWRKSCYGSLSPLKYIAVCRV
jgi:hypothetical protein